MKVTTAIACAASAAALPLGAAWATMPTGPQGTGSYGAANAAVPTPQTPQPYGASDPRSATAGESRAGRVQRQAQSSDARRDDERNYPWYRSGRTPVLEGFSADTNPPAPPP